MKLYVKIPSSPVNCQTCDIIFSATEPRVAQVFSTVEFPALVQGRNRVILLIPVLPVEVQNVLHDETRRTIITLYPVSLHVEL